MKYLLFFLFAFISCTCYSQAGPKPVRLFSDSSGFVLTSTSNSFIWRKDGASAPIMRIRRDSVNIYSPLRILNVTAPPSTYNILVHGLTDSAVYQISSSTFGNGIYGGHGSLPGNVTVTGANNSLTFNDIFSFHVNSDYNVRAKADGTGIYTDAVIGAGNVYEIGYTPVAGTFSKGAGIIIDTNNNVGVGTQPPTTMPLYATGASMFVQGLQSNGGNFNKVENHTANFTVNLAGYFHTIDATAGNIVATLPAASASFGNTMGIKYVFQRIDASANTVTIQRAGGDTINGGTSFTLTTQYTDIKTVQCTSASTWAQY